MICSLSGMEKHSSISLFDQFFFRHHRISTHLPFLKSFIELLQSLFSFFQQPDAGPDHFAYVVVSA